MRKSKYKVPEEPALLPLQWLDDLFMISTDPISLIALYKSSLMETRYQLITKLDLCLISGNNLLGRCSQYPIDTMIQLQAELTFLLNTLWFQAPLMELYFILLSSFFRFFYLRYFYFIKLLYFSDLIYSAKFF